jgi:hypothetical protein
MHAHAYIWHTSCGEKDTFNCADLVWLVLILKLNVLCLVVDIFGFVSNHFKPPNV